MRARGVAREKGPCASATLEKRVSGFPREALEELATLGEGEGRRARLRERAFYLARRQEARPYLAEAVAAGANRAIPFHVYEPSLLARDAAAFPPEDKAAVCLLPLDAFAREDEWDVSGTEEGAGTKTLPGIGLLRACIIGTETEVLESAAWGYTGVLLPVTGNDVFRLQFLVELARDCHITLVPLVETDAELSLVLETDCPYVGFGTVTSPSNDSVLSFFRMSLGRLPRGLFTLIFFAHAADSAHFQVAFGAGAEVVVGVEKEGGI